MWYLDRIKGTGSTDCGPCGWCLDGVCHMAGWVVSFLAWGMTARSIKAQDYICMYVLYQ